MGQYPLDTDHGCVVLDLRPQGGNGRTVRRGEEAGTGNITRETIPVKAASGKVELRSRFPVSLEADLPRMLTNDETSAREKNSEAFKNRRRLGI